MTSTVQTLDLRGETLEYVLRRSNRRTLGITMFPSGDVVVSAPQDVAQGELEKRIGRRAGWIRRAQREFESYRPRTPARRYVSGETHRYLGRQLRLLVRPEERRGTKLEGRFLVVGGIESTDTAAIGRAARSWYRRRAKEVLAERLAQCIRHFTSERIAEPSLTVKRLVRRWGSMSADASQMVLNTRLIEAGIAAIDYVIIHELCHVLEPHHGPGFYDLLVAKLPDWEKRKRQLERMLV